MLLPKKVGSFTLMRKLDADGMTESYVGILDHPAGQQVVARRILPAVLRDPGRLAQLRARIGDLRSARHPALVPVLDLVEADGDLYILEEWTDGTELRAIIQYCAATRTVLPHNVYLNLATQVCNALEALHSRPGTESGSENVLHLALSPSAMWVTADGRVTVGRYGLARSPTAIATQATGSMTARVEYLAPEQTHQDQKLTPASDIFALGSILYELLTLKPMFKADSHLQTIHRVRRAEVTTQLLEVKEILPGLDKVLFRGLSLNPRHRYQRAFVLREDLRGLMAGYTFADIDDNTRAFLAPIIKAGSDGYADEEPDHSGPLDNFRTDPTGPGESTAFLLGHGRQLGSDPSARSAGAFELRASAELDSDTDALLDSQSFPLYERLLEDDTERPDAPGDGLSPARMSRLPLADLEPPSGPLSEETNLTPIQRTGWVEERPSLGPQHAESNLKGSPLPVTPIESIDTGRPQRPDTGAFQRRTPGPADRLEATPSTGNWGDSTDTDALLLDNSTYLDRGDTLAESAEPPTVPTPEADPHEDTGPTPLAAAPQWAPADDDEADDWPPAPPPAPRKDPRAALQPPEVLRPPNDTAPPPRPAPAVSRRTPPPAPVHQPEHDFGDDDEELRPRSFGWMPALGAGVAVVTVVLGLVCLGVGGGGLIGLLASNQDREVAAADDPAPAAPVTPPATPPAPNEPAAASLAAAPPSQPAPQSARAEPPPERTPPRPPEPVRDWPSPAPREAVASQAPPRPRPPAPPPPPPAPAPAETWDGVAAIEESAPAAEAPLAVSAVELDAWSTDAFAGQLAPEARSRLADVPAADPGFTRARTLLFLDAKAQGDARSRDQHLAAMMAVPENRYNPVLLVEEAQLAADRKDWEQALARAALAEQHWARLPSDLVYTRKALIYEIQAVAQTSIFYESQGDDLDRLSLAIRGWERYQRHVTTRDRPELLARAEQSLNRLYEIQRRLQ